MDLTEAGVRIKELETQLKEANQLVSDQENALERAHSETGALQGALDKSTKLNEKLQAQFDDLKKKAGTVPAELKKSLADNEALRKDLEEALSLNDELQARLDASQKSGGKSFPEFSFKGKKYRFTKEKFHLPGFGECTATASQTEEDILEKLIKRGSPVLVDVDQEKAAAEKASKKNSTK